MAHTFEFGTQDAFGCTVLDPYTFRKILGLTHHDAIIIHRVNGKRYEIDALKCISRGDRHYRINLSDMEIPLGAKVTLRPHDHTPNHLVMTVVDTPERMYRNPKHLVDAVVELQYAVEELKEWSSGDMCT